MHGPGSETFEWAGGRRVRWRGDPVSSCVRASRVCVSETRPRFPRSARLSSICLPVWRAGHLLPDGENRYCINAVSVAGEAAWSGEAIGENVAGEEEQDEGQ